jgi:manganese oxidase
MGGCGSPSHRLWRSKGSRRRRGLRHRSGQRLHPYKAGETSIREFVLYYQDGLNHWDEESELKVVWADTGAPVSDAALGPARMVPDCKICDDSYDRGEKAVSQRSPAFSRMLRDALSTKAEVNSDLNRFVFPRHFALSASGQPDLRACEGEQIVVRVLHPGGRARQRAFAMNGYSYHDLFPGFGFPRAALLAPGKSISAWLAPAAYPGTVVWHDGPTHLRAGGTWGTLTTSPKGKDGCPN